MTIAVTASDRHAPSGSGAWLVEYRRRILVVVFVAALVVRVAVTLAVFSNDSEISGDMKSYHDYATAIVDGDWLGHPVSYREPGYPLFVAAVYALTGGSQLAARLANAILGALTCLGIYALARRVFKKGVFGTGVALASASWFAIYFHSVHYAAYLLRESLVTLLLIAFLIPLFDAARGENRMRSAVVAAFAYVLLVHTDGRFLFHAPFAILYLLVASAGGWRRGAMVAVVLAVVIGAGMIPWQARNYHVYHRIVLINTRTMVMDSPWREDSTPPPAVAWLEPPPPDTREGVRRLHGVRKALYDFTEFYRVFRFRGEVRNNSNTWERPWSAFHNWSSILMYGTLVPFFIFGYWRILRHRMVEAYILVLPVLAHTLLHVLKWGRDRYRTPIEPMLIIVAMYALALAVAWWHSRRTVNVL